MEYRQRAFDVIQTFNEKRLYYKKNSVLNRKV